MSTINKLSRQRSQAANKSAHLTIRAPHFKKIGVLPLHKPVLSQHEALKQLGALVLARHRSVRFRLADRHAWCEAARLWAQFEAICALGDFPGNFCDLPHPEQCAVRLQVAAACLEHEPQFARVLRAARFVNQVGLIVHYRVPSESSRTPRHVTLHSGNGTAFCTCPASDYHCYHIANALLMEACGASQQG